MENELVGFAADLLGAPDGVVGSVTSGGTESLLLAVRPPATRVRDVAARGWSSRRPRTRRSTRPPTTSASRRCPSTSATTSARTRPPMAAAIDERTVLVVASAPSYAHGVVDPVPEIAAAAAAAGVRCHVDACIGGWVLPYAARLGRPVTPWTFAVDGVTSISVDLHKYAYTPKGVSLLLHRDPSLRRPQYFASARWPGYTMLNSTMQSTKSGGPLAAAWAVVQSIGDDGYERLAAKAFDGVDRLLAGVGGRGRGRGRRTPGLDAGRARDRRQLRRVHDRRRDGGAGLVRPAADVVRRPAADPAPDAERRDRRPRRGVLRGARRGGGRGPRGRTGDRRPGRGRGRARRSTRRSSTEEEFDGLLAAAGLTPGEGTAALPARMAEVNALLDLASPELREAVLVAFLDRLFRPAR